MNKKSILHLLAALPLVVLAPCAFGQGTAFNYQGRLAHNGANAMGIFDLRFTIYDVAAGGNPVAGTITRSAVAVSNGLFSVTLDFGAGVFTGAGRSHLPSTSISPIGYSFERNRPAEPSYAEGAGRGRMAG
jgi:hypothetical protein